MPPVDEIISVAPSALETRSTMIRIDRTVQLTRHPESESPVVRGIEARVSWVDAEVLIFHYQAKADTRRVQIPERDGSRRADGLWRHTCFEAFIGSGRDPAYCELNFSPSGEWAAYYFSRYRTGGPLETTPVSEAIAARIAAESFSLDAVVHLQALPLSCRTAARLGLAAVIEEESGRLSYWALKHPPGRPDFHDRLGFALERGSPAAEEVNPRIRVP